MVTFQFIPYHEIEPLGSAKRVNKLLNIVKNNKIVIMEGQLNKQEEADLIEITMEEIKPGFSGIELSTIHPEKAQLDGFGKIKHTMINLLLGNRQGMTIIGPASIVKKIVSNPQKIELFTQEVNNTITRRSVKKRRKKR
ncbi:MAG: DUF2073 domain-containing protein [Nanoarchaeota archaeon]|nr:DUF2073 domain-containing protein [Nanoarchaeota archaeon]